MNIIGEYNSLGAYSKLYLFQQPTRNDCSYFRFWQIRTNPIKISYFQNSTILSYISNRDHGAFIIVCLLLFYATATIFQLYHGGDMMYEIRRRNPEPTQLLTQGNFNLPQHIGMVGEELASDDAVSYRNNSREMDFSTAKCYSGDWDSYPCPQGHIPHTLTNWANSSPLCIY